MNEFRTHNCGELRKENVGERVKIAGWIQKSRNLGGLLFIDLRDQYGLTQAVISGENELAGEVSRIPTESVVAIEGTVKLRGEGLTNTSMPTR